MNTTQHTQFRVIEFPSTIKFPIINKKNAIHFDDKKQIEIGKNEIG